MLFLRVVFLLAGKAHAETPVCIGLDMLAKLTKDNQTLEVKIDAEVEKTLNGQGLLWKLEKPNQKPSCPYGAMHVIKPRFTKLEPVSQKGFNGSQTLAIETIGVLDQQSMIAILMKQPELMMFTDNTTLHSLRSPDELATLHAAFEASAITPCSITKMKP